MTQKEKHYKRSHRLDTPGHAHELTFCCYKKQAFLSRERCCIYLAEAIIAAKEKHQFDLWAYVFMPEHVHVVLQPRNEDYSISEILSSVKQSVARRALIYLRKENPAGLKFLATGQKNTPYRFWLDGGGYDRNITSREALVSTVEYIHNNPVRRGLVGIPEDWLWSSAKEWNGSGSSPIPVDIDSFPSL